MLETLSSNVSIIINYILDYVLDIILLIIILVITRRKLRKILFKFQDQVTQLSEVDHPVASEISVEVEV